MNRLLGGKGFRVTLQNKAPEFGLNYWEKKIGYKIIM